MTHREVRVKRLQQAADHQRDALESLASSVEALIAVDGIDRPAINKAVGAADLALRTLRAIYAREIGRAVLGDALPEGEKPLE